MKKNTIIEEEQNGFWTVKPEKYLVAYTLPTRDGVFTGHANCNREDEFDTTKGKRLAKLRAILQLKKQQALLLRLDIELAKEMDPRNFELVRGVLADKQAVLRASIKNLEAKIKETADADVVSKTDTAAKKESKKRKK